MSDDPTPDDKWHCRQVPNGQEPIVVCEREDLLAEIEQLKADLGMCRKQRDAVNVTNPDGSQRGWSHR